MKTEAVIEYITGWLGECCGRAGTGGFVIGVSGGIDSAAPRALPAVKIAPVKGVIISAPRY